jgi:GNAT superfamily N-acetyltransferase
VDVANVDIRLACEADAESVAHLLLELFEELASPKTSGYQLAAVTHTARNLLQGRDPVWAFLAEAGGDTIGVITLNECAAIYAGGRFGEISELYVRARFRALGVGKRLLAAAVQFARQRGWSRLEVGAPEIPRWERAVTFYRQAGFAEVGPRLKLDLGPNAVGAA